MTDDPIASHQEALMTAFVALLRAEEEERTAKAAIKTVEDLYAPVLRQSRRAQEDAWEDIGKLMAETGEPEVTLPGDHCDYKIATSSTPEKVDVPDVNAVPDEFVKKEPKKKEIMEHLKALREAGEALPNWATLTRGAGSLCYKPVKKRVG
jgi:hypothetical protein